MTKIIWYSIPCFSTLCVWSKAEVTCMRVIREWSDSVVVRSYNVSWMKTQGVKKPFLSQQLISTFHGGGLIRTISFQWIIKHTKMCLHSKLHCTRDWRRANWMRVKQSWALILSLNEIFPDENERQECQESTNKNKWMIFPVLRFFWSWGRPTLLA